MLKATVILVLRRLPSVYALLGVLDEPEWAGVRARLCDARGRFPTRRTWERRLGQVAARLPVWIARVGRLLVEGLRLWEEDGRAVALDSTALQARGKPWHQRQRRTGLCPDTRIDRDAHWCQAGWHGWVYGYKLHTLLTVCPQLGVWVPLAAAVTPANVADCAQAPLLLDDLAPLVLARLLVLADSAYRGSAIEQRCARDGRVLVASRRGQHPPNAGTPVRQVFHALRSQAIENWHSQFRHIFDLSGQLPTRGLVATQRFVLGAVFTYQLVILDRFLDGRSLRAGLQAALQAA
ncbi:MAG TPA: transposase [Gammaproteobacteria bacterium]|nr:transposase [Gammaproteobacteria bacterium]